MNIKVLNIESQVVESYNEARLLELCLMLAKEAGYSIVRDNWGHNAYDEYSIDEAIERFKVNGVNYAKEELAEINEKEGDLPF